MKALILAAGYATRLYPLTREYPKPLLEVGHKPIIDYILDKLGAIDIDEIIVVTNSKFIWRFRNWKLKIKGLAKPISLIDDLTKDNASRLGAVGDINFVINRKKIKDDLLVVGADNLFSGPLNDFILFAQAKKVNPVIGAYDIKDKHKAKKYGVIRLDKENKLVDFQEKPKSPQSTLVAMCLYYFPKESLRLIEEYMGNKTQKSDATGSYVKWLKDKKTVYGFVFGGSWYDIGDYKFYHQAKQEFSI